MVASVPARAEFVLDRERLRRFSLRGWSLRLDWRSEGSRLFLPFKVGLSLRLGLRRGLRDFSLRAAGGDLAGLRDLSLGHCGDLAGLRDLSLRLALRRGLFVLGAGSVCDAAEPELLAPRAASLQMSA